MVSKLIKKSVLSGDCKKTNFCFKPEQENLELGYLEKEESHARQFGYSLNMLRHLQKWKRERRRDGLSSVQCPTEATTPGGSVETRSLAASNCCRRP